MTQSPYADPAVSPGTVPLWRKLYQKAGSFRLARRRAALRRGEGTLAAAPARLVISPGGVGTTFLMEHAARFVEINRSDDQDGLKHLPLVPQACLEGRRILFVTGDPDAILASLKRRGFLNKASAKLGCVFCQYTRGRLRDRAFLRAVHEQTAFFTAAATTGAQVLVVEYNDIWARAAEIGAFLGIDDPRFVVEFPQRKPRKSRVAS